MKKYIDNHQEAIEKIWLEPPKDNKYPDDIIEIIDIAIQGLNTGELRIAKPQNGEWITNQLYKKLVLLYFRINKSSLFSAGPWYDKVPLKFTDWTEKEFIDNKIRAVPGSIVRYGSHIGRNVVLMPSFVNIGAYIGDNSMIDSWATIGSCAQIGNNCHISGGAGIAGVLEPIQSNPVIIEDDCFIGARSEIAEGVIVGKGSVIAMGVYIAKSTKIVDKTSGKVSYGYIPPYSVVVPGSVEVKEGISQYAVLIIKQVDEKTRAKTSINELLR